MAPSLSVLSPSAPNESYPDDAINVLSDIVTRKIMSYPDDSSLPQNLTIGASADLAFESKGSTNTYIAPASDVNFYHSTINSSNLRTDVQFMTLSADSNQTQITVPNVLKLTPNDSDVTTDIGNMNVYENTSSQLLNTSKYDFKVMKNMSVVGNLSTTQQFFAPTMNTVNLFVDNNLSTTNQVTQGNLYGNNMNIWINKTPTNDKDVNQIGYGFFINSNTEQLELFKYKRYSYLDSNGGLQSTGKTQYRKVAHFGFGVMSYDQVSDIQDLNVFDPLDAIVQRSNQAGYTSNMAPVTSADSLWVLNSNANINYFGNVGVNNTSPLYALDVIGTISASDTVVSVNYATASDARIKTNLERLDNAVCLDKVKMLEPMSFTLITNSNQKSGFIAQELQKIIPEAIDVRENSKLGIPDFHYVDYNSVIAYLVGAIQELDNRVQTLEAQNKLGGRQQGGTYTRMRF